MESILATLAPQIIQKIAEQLLPKLTEAVKTQPPASPEEAKAIAEAHLQEALSQIDLTKLDLASGSGFRANWRSFIGWVAGASLTYELLVRPITTFIIVNFFPGTAVLPPAPAEFWRILLGMVGLS